MFFFMKMSLITSVMLVLMMIGLSIKLWSKKRGRFVGTCGSQILFLTKSGEGCSFCKRNFKACENQN